MDKFIVKCSRLEVPQQETVPPAAGSSTAHTQPENDGPPLQSVLKKMDAIYGTPNEAALLALMEKTGYHMIQENGQRKYGPPPDWVGPPPPRGCEIFVGKIPRDCYEDELVPAFERVGKIYEFRLMMDFSGSNRGYCFVMYTNRDDARRAITEMNNYEIRKGRYLGVCASVDNCRLFVGGIPKNKQQEDILEEMRKVTDGVVNVIVYPSVADKSKNRGFAFVEYESHRAAAMARRKLIPGRIQLWGHQIAVDWAEPEKEVDEDIMSRVKILYIRNLMLNTSEETLRQIFNCTAEREDAVERVKKIRDYAFVHFRERHDAIRAMKNINGKQSAWLSAILENNGWLRFREKSVGVTLSHSNNIDGSPVEVVWAKPVEKNSYIRYTRSGAKNSLDQSYSYPELQYMTNSTTCMPLGNNASDDLSARLAGLNVTNNGPLFLPPRNCLWGAAEVNNRPQFRQLKGHQEQLYDILPGMELTLANRDMLRLQQSKAPIQMLEEVCEKNRWGRPTYHHLSTVGSNTAVADGSGDVQLFACKIVIPALMNVFMANKLSTSIEKAQNMAAEHALHELGIPMEGGDASVSAAVVGAVKCPVMSQRLQPPPLPPPPSFTSSFLGPDLSNAKQSCINSFASFPVPSGLTFPGLNSRMTSGGSNISII